MMMIIKSFKKKLVKTDLKQKLSVPSKQYLELFPSLAGSERNVEFVARDKNEQQWRFICTIRKKGYPKPVINSKGWLQFVRAKGLKEGNEVIFSRHTPSGSGTSYYKVHVVSKTLQIMGTHVEDLA